MLCAAGEEVRLLASTPATEKLKRPLAELSVPEITPVALTKMNPGGKLPEVTDQVYGGVPPAAVRVAE